MMKGEVSDVETCFVTDFQGNTSTLGSVNVTPTLSC